MLVRHAEAGSLRAAYQVQDLQSESESVSIEFRIVNKVSMFSGARSYEHCGKTEKGA